MTPHPRYQYKPEDLFLTVFVYIDDWLKPYQKLLPLVAMTTDPKNPNSERLRLIREALEAGGDDALSASAMIRVRIAVDAAGAAISDVVGVLRTASQADRVIQGRIRWMRSVIADRVAELLSDLTGEAGDPESPRREIVLDLETKRSADGTPSGWSNPAGMGVSLVGCYHYRGGRFVAYRANRAGDRVLLEADTWPERRSG